jgi:DNA adenine methylase
MKSPLRYPGGKTRAVKYILDFIPNIKTLCSPFLGGGSVELECSKRGIKVYGYDLFEPLINFWEILIKMPESLSKKVNEYYPLSREKFYILQKNYNNSENDDQAKAAVFYVLNRCSFSGLTLSGGMSPNHPRFTLKGIEQLNNYKLGNLYVNCLDYKESLLKHKNDFLYLDPPYANGQALYGNKGDMHKSFDHRTLADILIKRDKWILSYNDCDLIRELYKDFEIVDLSWTYGMNHSKKSNEILVLSNNL